MRNRTDDPGVTTEVALFLTYLIGVLCVVSQPLAAGLAVVLTALLIEREALHRFATEWLTPGEMRDGVILLTVVLIGLLTILRIIGIDSSPEMIEAAKDDHPDMEFRICDALNLPSLGEDGFDVVFSNACIQWVPDHPRLIRDMLALLRPGGMLAVQVPMNYQEPIHRIIGELAASDEWRAELASARIFHTLSQEAYFDILAAEAGQFQMWQITYLHRMPSHEAIMDWYKGTGLRPYLSLLSGERAAAFEQAVLEEVAARYPKQGNGEIIFRFPRFFFTATPKA